MISNLPLELRDSTLLKRHIESRMYNKCVAFALLCRMRSRYARDSSVYQAALAFHVGKLQVLKGQFDALEKERQHYANMWTKAQSDAASCGAVSSLHCCMEVDLSRLHNAGCSSRATTNEARRLVM